MPRWCARWTGRLAAIALAVIGGQAVLAGLTLWPLARPPGRAQGLLATLPFLAIATA